MVVKRIERSTGGCYFIAAKFVDRSCQVILRLSWCCRSLTENGLECSVLSGRGGMVRSSASFGPPKSVGRKG